VENVDISLSDDLQQPCLRAYSRSGSRASGFENCLNKVPLTIGTRLLQQLRLYIASQEKKIYITRAPEEQAPAAGASGH